MCEFDGKKVVFSGVQPSGSQVHIGNYLGAMKRFVSLSKSLDAIFCIVDLHAMTSVEEPDKLEAYTQSLAAAYLAIGLDPEHTILFRQSDVPEVCELTWYLACQFPLGLLERGHAVKDARDRGLSVNSGLLFYPVLMAADILLYRAGQVPVGADQKQHIEMTRDVAMKFNLKYGRELFPVPEPLIDDGTGVIPGLDGRKMSKSYDNYIGLFESPKAVRKKVMRIVTDSKTVEEPKVPEDCNIFQLYTFFGTDEEQKELANRYRSGGLAYGHAKQALFEAMDRELSPLREEYESQIARPDDLRDILKAGAAKARTRAQETLCMVRDAVGVGAVL